MDFGELNGRLSPGIGSDLTSESLVWPVSVDGLDWLPLPTLVLAADSSAIAVNGAWGAMAGISPGDSRGNGWRQAIDPADRDALVTRLRSAAAAGEPGTADWRLAGTLGRRWSRWWWRPGPARGLVVCVTEIYSGRSGEPDDWRRTEHAGVSALLNPGQFLTLVGRGLQRSSQADGVLAVVVVGLGGLAAGDAAPGTADRLLGVVIGRLAGATRTADVVARTGACTFAVLYEHLHDQAEAEMVARRLGRSLGQPIDVDGRSHAVVVATGIAVASGPGEQAEALLARAEVMLAAVPQTAGRRRGAATVPRAACPVAGAVATPVAAAAPATGIVATAPAAAPATAARLAPASMRQRQLAPAARRRPRASSEIDLRIELTSAVVQRISWVALILASAVSLTEGQAAERVHSAVDELDTLIRDIRASVFPLLIPPSAAAGA